MDLTTAALGLIPAVLLCAQGIDCLSRARESATLGWFGLLALMLIGYRRARGQVGDV